VRVLVVHNRYRSDAPSGENRVVDHEIDALREAGLDVATYLRSSDEISKMSLPRKMANVTSAIHSPSALKEIRRVLLELQPHVLHLHNPYPLISMSVVRLAHSCGVPVVHTVHNHRHTCMSGSYQRAGHDCHDCLGRGPWPGAVHGCYRGSRVQSTIMAAALISHRRTYDLISRFVVVTPQLANSLRTVGVHPDRITVKPNAVPDPGPVTPPGAGFAYVGRLSREKGVPLLLEAWKQHPENSLGTLTIAGDGPAADEVRRLSASRRDVTVLGAVPPEQVVEVMRAAAAVVVPSTSTEGLPLTVLEAFSLGRPVIVSDVSGLAQVVDAGVGWVVDPTPQSWAAALAQLPGKPALAKRGAAARQRYVERYTPEKVTRRLIKVYEQAADQRLNQPGEPFPFRTTHHSTRE